MYNFVLYALKGIDQASRHLWRVSAARLYVFIIPPLQYSLILNNYGFWVLLVILIGSHDIDVIMKINYWI